MNQKTAQTARQKHILIRIIEHRIFGLILTVLGVLVPIALFTVLTNYRNLVYPTRSLDQVSPQQYVDQRAKNLPPNITKPEVIEHGSRFKHQIALTFDADMTYAMQTLLERKIVTSWYNSKVVDLLRQNQVKATFFLTGLWVKTYPQQAYQIAQDPLFEIGNHSYSHSAFTFHCFGLPAISNSQDFDEVENAQQIIVQTTNITPQYFRFPGGCYDNIDLATIAKLGLRVIHWDVASSDAFNQDTNSIVSQVLTHIKNGSIVVFHLQGGANAPKTEEALALIIPNLKKQGYQLVTISELLSN